jgi:hypothetical protein
MLYCPAGTLQSLKQYEKGEFTPGWLFKGLSSEEAKKWIDGMIDTDAKKTALEYWKKYYLTDTQTEETTNKSAETNSEPKKVEQFAIGKFILNNESSKTIQVGVDGPMSTSWLIKSKERIDDILIPGIYTVWYDKGNGAGRIYPVYKEDTPDGLHKKGDPVLLEMTLTPKNFGEEKTSGYINIPTNF